MTRSQRDVVPPVARRAVERALAERERLAETVRETVRPMTRRDPVRLVKVTAQRAWRDRVWGLAAEAAFWQLLSLPPLFLALLGSLGYFGDLLGEDTITAIQTDLLNAFSTVFTANVVDDLVAPTVSDVLTQGRPEVISIGFVVSLWAGSSATATFVNTITIAYGMRDLRGAVRSRLIALWLYIASVGVGTVLLPLLVLGPSKMVRLLPAEVRPEVYKVSQALYWPVVGGLLVLGLTSLYHLAVPKRLPWHRGLPGSVVAMVIFLLGGHGLRAYIAFVASEAFPYRALGTPIAALLFLFLLALAVLLGAELNASIEERWPSRPSRKERRRERRERRRAEWRAELDQANEVSTAVSRAHSELSEGGVEVTEPVPAEGRPAGEMPEPTGHNG